MSIGRCSKCDREISDAFNSCVYCGDTKRKSGFYVEKLNCLYSLQYNSGTCKLIVSKSEWKIEYCFREYQKHNLTSFAINGCNIDSYIKSLRSNYAKYIELRQYTIEELKERDDVKHYWDFLETVSICGDEDMEIRLGRSLDGVCLDGYCEVRIDSKYEELEDTIKEWQYARERATVIMPFLKFL